MKFKKLISGLLSAVMAISACTVPADISFRDTALAATYSPDAPCTATSGNCGRDLTWTLNSGGVLTISGKGNMSDYNGPGSSPFNYRQDIKSLVLEEGVTHIGNNTFSGCSQLAKITFCDTLTSIGTAFVGCSAFKNIVIPESVTTIGNQAFYGCSGLKSVTVRKTVTSIGSQAFDFCSSLETIYGNKGSAAEEYASKYSVNFVELPDDLSLDSDTPVYTLEASPSTKADAPNRAKIAVPLDATQITFNFETEAEVELALGVYGLELTKDPWWTDEDVSFSVTPENGKASFTYRIPTKYQGKVSKVYLGFWYPKSGVTITVKPEADTLTPFPNPTVTTTQTTTTTTKLTTTTTKAASTTAKPSTAASDNFSVDVSSAEAEPGENFSIIVSLNNIPSSKIDTFEFAVSFDNSLVKINEAKKIHYKNTGNNDDCDNITEDQVIIAGRCSPSPLSGSADIIEIKGTVRSDAPKGSVCEFNIVPIDRASTTVSSEPNTVTIFGYYDYSTGTYVNFTPVINNGKLTVSGGVPAATTTKATTTTTKPVTTTTTTRPTTTTTKATTTTTTTTTTRPATTTTKTTTTAKPSTTTLPIVTNGSFAWGRDNWNFENSRKYFSNKKYELDDIYRKTLRKNLTNIEWENAQEYILDTSWGGSCYGMSALAALSRSGILPYSRYKDGASCLHDLDAPADNSSVNSLINYYHCLQIKNSNQQRMFDTAHRSNEENLNEITELLENGRTVLIGFAKSGWGGHSVMAYGINYGIWKVEGIRCDGRIEILDPNYSMEYNEDACIYFNSENGYWTIPAYDNGRLASEYGAYFNQIIADVNVLNCGGYLNGSGEERVVNFYSKLEIASADKETYSVNKVKNESGVFVNQAAGKGEIISDKFYFFSGESEGIDGYLLRDSESAYMINQKKKVEMDLRINYENYLIKASAAAGSEIIFDPTGYASISGMATDYSFTLVSNDGYCPNDWYKIKVNGENANMVSLKKTSDGYIMKGNNLENVEVAANNDDATAERSFSTEYDSVYIYEVDENTIGIKVDTDSNGTYETELGGTPANSEPNPTNPTDSDSNVTTVPADAEHTVYGDTNLDGAVNVADVVQLNKFLLNKNDNPIKGTSLANADCMKDGYIDSSDSTILMNYVSMQITADKLGVQ